MSARITWMMFWVLALLAAVGASPSAAQVSVLAKLTAERVYVGDQAGLRIQVDGSKSAEQPQLPTVPGLVITFVRSGPESHIMTLNGRRTPDSFDGCALIYSVVPTQPGRFTIPAITVTVNGKKYTTAPVALTAVDPGKAEGFKLVLEADKTDVYVGEPVRVRLTWYLLANVSPRQRTFPEDAGSFELLPAPAPNVPGRQIKVFEETAIQGRGQLDGEDCVTVTMDRVFVARRAGTIKLGPVRVSMDVEVEGGFFGAAERKVIASNTLEFAVKDLPSPRPANFNGLIGEYKVEATATPLDVHVGDPITLTVFVTGPEPLEAVPAMIFADQPGFEGKFKAPSEPAIPSVQATSAGRAAVFTQMIRAENDGVKEIPAIALPYFDVATGKYGEARSKPIPLRVRPTTEVGLPGEPGGGSARRDPDADKVGGLVPIVTSQALLTEGAFDTMGALRSPAVVGVLGGPALVYFGSAGVLMLRRRAERDPARRRRRLATGRALRRLRRAQRGGDVAAAAGAALRGFVADWFDLPEAGLTSAECVERLRETGVKSAESLAMVLESCDAELYAGARELGSGGPLVAEAATALRALCTELERQA